MKVPFKAIFNKNTFTTVTDYYKHYKREGYVTTDDRQVLQAVSWVFTNAKSLSVKKPVVVLAEKMD